MNDEEGFGAPEPTVPFVYVTADNVILFHEREVGPGMLRDRGALEAAVYRPQATAFGEDAFPGLASKAAALLQAIDQAHSFVDGNKRAAWGAMGQFLLLNGHFIQIDVSAGYDLALNVANHRLDTIEEIAATLKFYIVRMADPPLHDEGDG